MVSQSKKPSRAAPVRVRVSPESTVLERLAVAYADPIRLKIVTALFSQEMSPSGFRSVYGGGSSRRVERHFKRLVDHAWLRHVRHETGGRRRGSTEHFFRAPKLAAIDTETWGLLPPSLRHEFSWRTFEQFAERVKDSLEAGTFDARPERHFTWSPLVLDERGRSRAIEAVDSFFLALGDEKDDARLRLDRSGETAIHTTVGLAAFDSPRLRRNLSGLLVPSAEDGSTNEPVPFPARMARVFGNSVNLQIVAELNLRAMSPSLFSGEFGHPLRDVYRRFQTLTDDKWLEKVGQKTGGKRKGGIEHFFRATRLAIFDTRQWSTASKAVCEGASWKTFEQLAEQVKEALHAGTFDQRTDRHLTWTPLALDQQGWNQIITKIDALFYFLLEEQKAAKQRLRTSLEDPQIATIYLAAFESPPPSEGLADQVF